MPALSPSLNSDANLEPSSHLAVGDEIDVLPRIFEDAINIAVMRRRPSAALQQSAQAQCLTDRAWQLAWLGQPGDELRADLLKRLPAPEAAEALIEDVQLLAEAMACLFDTETVGIRLRLLDAAMCPRFHVDNLPVRLVSTYHGPGSEWLPEAAVERAGLGAPSASKPEIVRDHDAIQRLAIGDLALLKGAGWEGNEHRALVHRSPAVAEGQKRLLLTIDPA
ncbi:DUF1826 domain-containing protein [Halomonas campisalis]|uniref:DUF1826 domain-containing protein n=2 Tax=Billgrantia campisalis TaxID=74661 RepID=A0ABS9PCT7_9GAMM|nr:DUF1826 domain-containing protein [Halomonas campisalis]MCG6659589.1 DUF1826 domain-containing protein [Halomonas campisalis]MDR5864550.1 DUF1826 domain-containing protein [Halomonas campisalis]